MHSAHIWAKKRIDLDITVRQTSLWITYYYTLEMKHIFATWERKYAMFVMTYRFSMSHFNGSFCQFTFLYHHIFTWYEKWHFRFLKTWLIEHHHHIHAIFTKNCWAKYKDQRAVGMKGYRCVFKKIYFKSEALDILFSSNHNIHKSSCGLCVWASDPLIERFY